MGAPTTYPDGVKSRTRKLLDAMIDEATIDCYNYSERATGFYTLLDERLAVPFQARFQNVDVDVTGVDLSKNDQIMAICVGGGVRHRIPILELTLPAPPLLVPNGSTPTATGADDRPTRRGCESCSGFKASGARTGCSINPTSRTSSGRESPG